MRVRDEVKNQTGRHHIYGVVWARQCGRAGHLEGRSVIFDLCLRMRNEIVGLIGGKDGLGARLSQDSRSQSPGAAPDFKPCEIRRRIDPVNEPCRDLATPAAHVVLVTLPSTPGIEFRLCHCRTSDRWGAPFMLHSTHPRRSIAWISTEN